MAKKSEIIKQNALVNTYNPAECPYKEFKDNELSPDFWGVGPSTLRSSHTIAKPSKSTADLTWVDEQAQPLPRSARQYLHSWVRAEDLALNRWNAEVVIFEENNGGKMSIMDIQLSHAQVMLRSSFCRRVLSLCYILERVDGLMVEHQWENFTFNMGTEGWRPKYHIYSPGLKPGGGPQHRPTLSKNGCYLVRLFYLGAWRCVWISDQVPVDATESPLLPFSPLLNNSPTKPGVKQAPAVTSNVVHLWPLLICKALLKLAAPDMNDEDTGFEDEVVLDFDILHAMTGGLNLTYKDRDYEELWRRLSSEVPAFSWDDDDDTLASTTKSRSTKKPATKETTVVRRGSMTSIIIEDTKNMQPYTLPGISPGHEMDLIVNMIRDVPLKKPLPEPDVPLWKTIRWVDWARHHGLYEAYDCPRTRFLKVNGLLKLSYAPHLIDLQSTESITFRFREEHEKTNPTPKKGKDINRSTTANSTMGQQNRDELHDWIQYDMMQKVIKSIAILYYPSMYRFTTAASNPPIRITKAPPNKALDIPAPKYGPLYLQIDGPDENILRISLNVLNPRVLLNCGVPMVDEIESAYLVLDVFEWFIDCELPRAKAYIQTKGYDAVEVTLPPGRHFCRLWIHSRTTWYAMLLSESTLLLGTRDLIQSAAVRECPWASRFLSNLGAAFSSWIKVNRSNMNVGGTDLEFYRSYQPDLEWNSEIVGYNKALLHWMFRQALQSLLIKRLPPTEFRAVCIVLRKYLCDPDFGLPPKPASSKSLRGISLMDPCDCIMPEAEEVEIYEELLEEQQVEEKSPVSESLMNQLLTPVKPPVTSQVCELATEELPCGLLKKEREKVIRKHEAATLIQAHWRGAWARKCLTDHVVVAPEVLKMIMENAFGNLEALSALMNEFFRMFPGAKYAYSVASALSGVYGLQQYAGTCHITPKCKWIPYFQGVFNCHTSVQVHLDVQSSIQHSTLAVYNNDTSEQMPQAYNSHITFHFEPNENGYTIIGHGCLNQPPTVNTECHWQLTILSSTAYSFHICDNKDPCKEMTLATANKMHIDEIFIPNRRNILGGIQLLVSKHEVVSFRAASTSPELKMVAVLKTISKTGEISELGTCSGVGELYWPYIRLEPTIVGSNIIGKKHSMSQLNLTPTVRESIFSSARSFKGPKQKQSYPGGKNKSSTKLRDDKVVLIEPKQYCIEVVAPNGWPLTISQWIRVDEIRNSQESKKLDIPIKKPTKEKGSAKDKDKSIPGSIYQPEAGDAYIELECSVSESCSARRDDGREIEFSLALKSWDANEPGRNLRGAEIRKEFRSEFLEVIPVQPSENSLSVGEEQLREEIMGEDGKDQQLPLQQGPTPATESGILEMSVESQEEAKFLQMPEQLRDKFIPLYFVPLCTKELNEDEKTILTLGMAEMAEICRQERIKLALERMRQLQEYNEIYVLGRQKRRCHLLENLFVDAQWKPELNTVLEERDEAVAREALRILSATKKKQEEKKKK